MGKEGRERSRSRDRRGGGEKRERAEEDKRSRRKSSAQDEVSIGDRKGRKGAKEAKDSKELKETKEVKEVKSSKEVKPSKEAKDAKESKKEANRESRKEPKADSRKEAVKGSKKDEGRTAATKDASRKDKGKKEAKAEGRSRENGDKTAQSDDDDAEALRLAAASAAASASVKESGRKERPKESKEPNGKERRFAEADGTPKAKKRKVDKKDTAPTPPVPEPAAAPEPEPRAPAKEPEVPAPVAPVVPPTAAQEEEPLPLHVRSLDSPVPSGGAGAGGGGSSSGGSAASSYSGSASDGEGGKRKSHGKGRRNLRAATGFGLTQTQSVGRSAAGVRGIPSPPREMGPAMFGPSFPSSSTLALLPEKVRGIVEHQKNLSEELMKLKQGAEARGGKEPAKEESKETMLRMPPRLHEALLHPDNEPKLLARTGLAAACLNEDGLVVLRGYSRKGLMKALGQLRRVAYHCQWGCTQAKVAALLSERPTKPVNTMVVRLAATSSKLQSFEVRLTNKVRKLRIGTQSGSCQLVVEGIPGLSRKHCTITLEPEKGACYVQDLSTNGTYLNGKRLPRPPYKNIQDARVRVFHGDELFFRLRSEEAEELGYVVNLLELS